MACNATSAVNHGQRLSNTSSRCITESFTATHDFEVADYPLLDGMGVGEFVTSGTFSVGGHEWNIRFYPDGKNKDCAGNASAFLIHLSPAKRVRTRFNLNMLEKKGKVQITSFSLSNYTFSPIRSWGYLKFVETSKLKSASDGNNGSFVLRCVLTVIKQSRTEVKANPIVVPQPNLQDHLQQMRKDGEPADVITFNVSDQVFSAHRCLLAARSPVFKAELFGAMKEKAMQCIKIDDIEPPIFDALLHFIYTDSLPGDYDDCKEGKTAKLQHLLVAADRYGVERLKLICESKLSESIDVETAATTLVLADQHHCKYLQEACIKFMASRNMLGKILATDGFKHLVASCPSVMKDILDKVSQGDGNYYGTHKLIWAVDQLRYYLLGGNRLK